MAESCPEYLLETRDSLVNIKMANQNSQEVFNSFSWLKELCTLKFITDQTTFRVVAEQQFLTIN